MTQIDRLVGTGLPLRGDSIDTDRIMPARFLRAITFSGLEAHLFEDDRREVDARAATGRGSLHPFSDPAYARASILLVNANFGCGSSREHAPQALHRRGIRAVVGESFSGIFFSNSLALGMPCVTASREAVERLMSLVERRPSTPVALSLSEMLVAVPGEHVPIALAAAARESFRTGEWDVTGRLLEATEAAGQVAMTLPYIVGF
jgi:3-isopropylmalate/(R)-2-methylmalate dehydratase small subunit